MDLIRAKIRDLRRALDSKEISAAELYGEYFRRIEAVDKDLLSYITVTKEKALSDAENAQKLIDAGKSSALTGIPLAVKDNICIDGVRTTCASRMLENFVPPYNATVIDKLNAQGYVLLGRTSMDEFAMGGSNQTSAFAKTRNPYDLERVPGGSSGGSAAAVAASLAPAALGSDTGGSIRQPASFCGVTGIKPTYGRVSRYGLVAFASSLDQIGPIGSDARDCAVLLNAICGHDRHDATSAWVDTPDFTEKLGLPIKGMRIALPKEFYAEGVDDEVKTAVMNAAHELEKQGAVLVECSMPGLKYAIPAYYLIACAEAASNLSRFDGIKYGFRGEGRTYEELIRDSRSRGFGEEVKRRILLGNYALSSGYYDAYYKKALALKQEIIRQYNRIFESADVVLTPTAPTPAYKIGSQDSDPVKMYQADICTVTVNIAKLPGISTTCGYTKDGGLPIGMSIIGKRFDEQTILQCADAFEQGFEPIAPKL
ncbi:MAG: Asp-tRNA(Asn)/Glu-tRNA(Gln) amidotransferase subunit GatA [Lachnospiraceae bacterium]|nr:Asp-tRNA(Asn)/Glu-tRNA(Gln) amidotransferase subunit GatA [Ruminococcus sp.]MCM1276215.1 Asp-tRNA(Asn)/Glu-tRNA(Gln) amidotransferase subunit GatA [Lachnospiraceae bacterium]